VNCLASYPNSFPFHTSAFLPSCQKSLRANSSSGNLTPKPAKSFIYRFLAPSEVEGYAVRARNPFIYRFYADSRSKSFIYRFYAFAPGWQGHLGEENGVREISKGMEGRK
jgi:hypothetical protein